MLVFNRVALGAQLGCPVARAILHAGSSAPQRGQLCDRAGSPSFCRQTQAPPEAKVQRGPGTDVSAVGRLRAGPSDCAGAPPTGSAALWPEGVDAGDRPHRPTV